MSLGSIVFFYFYFKYNLCLNISYYIRFCNLNIGFYYIIIFYIVIILVFQDITELSIINTFYSKSIFLKDNINKFDPSNRSNDKKFGIDRSESDKKIRSFMLLVISIILYNIIFMLFNAYIKYTSYFSNL